MYFSVRRPRPKKRPTHDLRSIQAKFADVTSLEITRTAENSAKRMGYDLNDVWEAVQDLEPGDFVRSEPAHSPPVPGVWHDTYTMRWDGMHLYIKFAGTTVVDIVLTSFKENTS